MKKTQLPGLADGVIEAPDRFPVEIRQLVCHAVNALVFDGKLPKDQSYAFVIDGKGRERVMLWVNGPVPGTFTVQPTYDDPKELIVSAGGEKRLKKMFGELQLARHFLMPIGGKS